MPAREDLHMMAAGAGIGYLETEAGADANHALNKIPRPVKQLGYTGGTALALWVAAKLTGSHWLRVGARAAAVAAFYQMGRHKGMFDDSSKVVTMSGADYLGHDEMAAHIIDDEHIGSLAAEGEMSGVPYDHDVEHAASHA
jgi:hypothetical protein